MSTRRVVFPSASTRKIQKKKVPVIFRSLVVVPFSIKAIIRPKKKVESLGRPTGRPIRGSCREGEMLSAVAALVLSQDKTGISSGAGQTTVATAKGSNPATDTYPGSVPPEYVLTDAPPTYVLTDAGIDTTCTDIDFEDADVTVSNLGGTDHCCTWCEGSASSKYLCCPTAAPGGGTVCAPPPACADVRSQLSDLNSPERPRVHSPTAPCPPCTGHRQGPP